MFKSTYDSQLQMMNFRNFTTKFYIQRSIKHYYMCDCLGRVFFFVVSINLLNLKVPFLTSSAKLNWQSTSSKTETGSIIIETNMFNSGVLYILAPFHIKIISNISTYFLIMLNLLCIYHLR